VRACGARALASGLGGGRVVGVCNRSLRPCTVWLSTSGPDLYTGIANAMVERSLELMSHGLYHPRYRWGLSEDDERAAIDECQQIHRRITGKSLTGWFSPAASNTLSTPDLVAEAGIRYLCDLYHDDQPTPIQVRQGELTSLPYSMEINDSIAWRRGQEAAAFAQKICDEFDTLYAGGAEHAKVMNIAVHPFIMGQPHRIEHLARALDYILGHDGVWCATGSEIVASYRAQMAADSAPDSASTSSPGPSSVTA